LLYLGDVPVESSFHGSTLLYRLLQLYPADRLVIIEGTLVPPSTDRRLPGVKHATLAAGRARWLNTRCHDQYAWWLTVTARSRAGRVRRLLGDFEPEAVVTVPHGQTWITAAAIASSLGIPLHLIIHDDWPRIVPSVLQARVERLFAETYRQAASRLCTSPFMAEEYDRRYGQPATVLLPYRAVDAPVFPPPAVRPGHRTDAPVFAFAGTINSPGYASLLRRLANAVGRMGGHVLIFGPLTIAQARGSGLDHPAIRIGGLVEPSALMQRLRAEADVLFVPMSFAPEDKANMQMGFPSKLTDYTAAAMPLLICGPSYCSAVRWAARNPGVAEVVAADDDATLEAAVERLTRDAKYRLRLAARAQQVGDRDFSAAGAAAVFQNALRGAQSS
jgi:glycosyltransferase involved in cell wall biosynthesis